MTPSFFAKKVDFWTDCLKPLCISMFEYSPLSVHFQSTFSPVLKSGLIKSGLSTAFLYSIYVSAKSGLKSGLYPILIKLLIINDIRARKVTVQKSTFFADF